MKLLLTSKDNLSLTLFAAEFWTLNGCLLEGWDEAMGAGRGDLVQREEEFLAVRRRLTNSWSGWRHVEETAQHTFTLSRDELDLLLDYAEFGTTVIDDEAEYATRVGVPRSEASRVVEELRWRSHGLVET